jgi:hypothetical protein
MPQSAPIFFLKMVAAFVIGTIGRALLDIDNPQSLDRDGKTIDHGIMANQTSDQAIIPLRYGICRGGVNNVYVNTRGSDNRYMDLVAVLGEGELSGIVREDDSIYSAIGSVMPSDNPPLVYFDDTLWTDWSDYTSIRFFNGSSTQGVSSTLSTYDTNFAQAMRRTSYLHIRYLYDREEFNRMPNVTVVTQGLKVYNPVTTAWAFSNNAALCALDYMTRPSTRGGLGLDIANVDVQTVSDAIDYCDDKGWTCNMIVNQQRPAADNLQMLLECFHGRVPPSDNGIFRLLFRDLNYEATVMDLTEADVVEGSFSMGQPDILNRPNAIRMQYYPSEHNYQLKDFVFTDTTALSTDGDYREVTRGPFGFSSLDLVQNMAYYLLERIRNGKTVTLTGGRRTLALEPEDLVTLTHDVPGWTQQTLRVLKTKPNLETWTNQLVLLEESTEFYDADYDDAIEDLFQTNLVDPSAPVPSVRDVSHYETVYNYRGRSETRWTIEFDPPLESTYPWFDYAEVWVRIGDGDWVYKTRSERDYFIQPAQEGETYTVKLVSVSIFGKKEPFESAISISRTIIGKTDDPSDLSYLTAVADGSTVNIYSTGLDDPDIDGYEVRMGDSFLGGIFISYHKAPTVKLVGVRPGTHTFWMSPVRLSTTGLKIYSANPVSASCTVFIPPGYSSVDSEAWDFDSIGSHNNTEHVTYNSDDALKCSHTSSVLTGTWTSPVWDLTSSQKVKVWADFETAFVSSDTTVEGIFGATLTPEDTNLDSLTVAELIGAIQAGRVEMVLNYSEDGSTYSQISFFELMSAEVEARYFYLEVTIIDPTLDSNMYCKDITMYAYSGPQ